jgi:TonB family protein
MQSKVFLAIPLLLLAGRTGWADLTLHYTYQVKFGDSMPAAAVEMAKQQMGALLPPESVIQVKGDRSYSTLGSSGIVADYAKGEITIVNTKTKQFATIPIGEFASQLMPQNAQTPEAQQLMQQMLQNMKFDVQSHKTGQMAMVQGIRAEENLVTIGIQMPTPNGEAAGFAIRMEMRTWIASADELNRIPALKELAVYAARATKSFDPAAMMQQAMAQFPGVADKMRDAMAALTKDSGNLTVKMKMSVFMPGMAKMLQATGQAPAAGSADGPLVELNMDVAGISTDPVPDSAFEVPAGFTAAPAAELAHMLNPTVPPQAKGNSANAAQLPPPADGVGRIKVGGNVQAASLISHPAPVYPAEAKAAGLAGKVSLQALIGPDGHVETLNVLSGDPILADAAQQAVKQWVYKPTLLNGKPVEVVTTIEVNFTLQP